MSIVHDNPIRKESITTILGPILDAKSSSDEELYFRGESKKHEFIIPSLYTEECLAYSGSEEYYRSLLSELGLGDYQSNADLINTLSEFQHYGAKTRLLDVSKNPLVALFFACEERGKKDNGYDRIISME